MGGTRPIRTDIRLITATNKDLTEAIRFYEQALALKESGKLPESRALFEALAKNFAGLPEEIQVHEPV